MPNYFPTKREYNQTIYAYKLIGVAGKEDLLKVGYTTKANVQS